MSMLAVNALKYDKCSEFKTVSYVSYERVLFEWKIKNYQQCASLAGEKITSLPFSSSDATWELWLFPLGTKNAFGEIKLSLIKQSSANNAHTVEYAFGLKDKNGVTYKYCEHKDIFNIGTGLTSTLIYRSDLFSRSESLLPDDILTVCCDMVIKRNIVLGEAMSVTVEQEKTKYALPCSIECIEGLTNEFATLYGDKESCDVTLKAEDKEFLAHKDILGARSSVFRAMFLHDMQEKRNSFVEISDLSASVVEAMLWYIYSGKVSNVNLKKVMDLFIAADKYALADLKTECSRCMIANLSTDNFYCIAGLAGIPGDETLLDALKHYFRYNASCILKKEKWSVLVRESPYVTSSLLETVVFPLFFNESSETV